MEFWGDDVEEIRSFAVADQRTLEPVERLWAPPCRELLLTDDVRRRAAALGAEHPQLAELTDKIADGIAVEGMESLAPVLVDEMELLVDLLPADTHVLVLDPERVRTPRPRPGRDQRGVPRRELGGRRRWRHRPRSTSAPRRSASSATSAQARARAGQGLVDVSPFGLDDERPTRLPAGSVDVRPAEELPRRRRARDRRHPGLGRRRHPGRACSARATARRSGWSRCSASTTSRPGWSTTLARRARRRDEPDVVTVTCGSLDHGFVDPTERLALLTGEDLSASGPPPATCARCRPGARSRSTRSSSRPATTSSTSSTASAGSWR